MAQNLSALSERVDVMRLWWAAYVHDGVTFTPEAVGQMTAALAELKGLAEQYEDLLGQANQLCLATRVERLSRRAAIDAALTTKGLRDKVFPASALLTEEHLTIGNVRLHPRSWQLAQQRESATP